MQTSFKAFLIQFPFPAKLRKRRAPLAADEFDNSDVAIPHSLTLKLGKSWRAIIDPKWITCVVCAPTFYILAALLGNEWLYLLCCALAVAAFMGALLPYLMLSVVAVDSWLPDKGIAHDNAQITISIRHAKFARPFRWLVPLNSLRTQIILARRGATGFVPNKDLGEQSLLLDTVGTSTTLALAVPHLERGVFKMSHVSMTSSFPFGLVWWTRKIVPTDTTTHSDTIVVYPRIYTLRGNFLLQVKGMLSTMGMAFSESRALTESTSVRGLREFRVGDSLRHIHWASSARLSKLLVREFDSETLPVFDLYLDLTANWASREQFELAVCLAHSLIQFGYEHDMLPELFLRPQVTDDYMESLMCDLPPAKAPLEMLSEILARVEPIKINAAAPEIATRRQLLSLVPSTERVLRHTKSGDQASYPVNLVAVQPDASGEMPASRASGEVLATIYSDSDLEAL